MPLMDTRGPEFGVCNICGKTEKLTVDHTPPKGYARAVPMRISHIVSRLAAEPATREQRVVKSSDGVKFRTLCARCNNVLLGGSYDRGLIEMAQKIDALLTTGLYIPATSMVRVQPQRVMKAVLGHMCAQGVGRYDKGAITEPVRDYLTDPGAVAPDLFRMHYWVYPYKSRILIRDAMLGTVGVRPASRTMIWLMKCYPVAFAITWDLDFKFLDRTPRNFDAFARLGIDDYADLPVDLNDVPHELWPEAVQDPYPYMLLLGQEALAAQPSPPRGTIVRVKK